MVLTHFSSQRGPWPPAPDWSQIGPRLLPSGSRLVLQIAPRVLPETLMPENDRNFMKIGLNGVAMSPHELIFDEDEATGCPMPLEALPTLFKVVLSKL